MDALSIHLAEIAFYALAGMAVAGAAGVVTLRKPLHEAASLLFTFLVVAGLFALRQAPLLAGAQVAGCGGVAMLLLVVIARADLGRLDPERVFLSRRAPDAVLAGILLGALMAAAVLLGVTVTGGHDPATVQAVDGESLGKAEAIGSALFTTFLVPSGIASLVLLVAAIGLAVLGAGGTRPDEKQDAGGGVAT